jgi:hypothetical protein
MPIFDTFTKRKREAARAGKPEVYQYDLVPEALRVQVFYMWREALGGYQEMGPFDYSAAPPSNRRWETIRNSVARERGVLSLSGKDEDPFRQCGHLLLFGDTDDALEIIEMTFRYIDVVMRRLDDWQREQEGLTQSAEEAIAELNHRLKEHRVGYQYQGGMLVRVDSQLLHNEATVPAIQLLNEQGFEGALDEFMRAHDHYRKGELKDANVDALNALESTLKAICDKRKWKYSSSATATDLVRIVAGKGLLPPELQSHFHHLIKAMKSGLPPLRHNYGGHGQGSDVKDVADHLAAYSLHLMASNIVLLIEAHRAKI